MTEREPASIKATTDSSETSEKALPPRVLMRSPLWLSWLAIAHEHAAEARESAAKPEAGTHEFRASMVAVTAAAFALDGLYGSVRQVLPQRSRGPRHRQILELLKLGFLLGPKANSWIVEFDWLYAVRDPAVHHGEQMQPAVQHPEIEGLQISVESRDYSAASAERAVAVLIDVVTTCFALPKPCTREWAELRGPAVDNMLAALGAT